MIVALSVLSIVAAYIDASRRVIPNPISLAVALCGIALQVTRLLVLWVPATVAFLQTFPMTYHIAMELPSALSCLGCAAALLVISTVAEFAVRQFAGKAGMGFGDIKFIAAWACTLGWYILPALAAACLLGAAYALSQHQTRFAFGPWLALAFVGTLFILLFIPTRVFLV